MPWFSVVVFSAAPPSHSGVLLDFFFFLMGLFELLNKCIRLA